MKINPSSMRFEEEITDLLVSLADPLRCHLSKREISSRVRHSTHLNNPTDIHISNDAFSSGQFTNNIDGRIINKILSR